jgi:hypothetical protein
LSSSSLSPLPLPWGSILSSPGQLVANLVSSGYEVSLPSTALAGMIENGEYPDIFYSTNLQNVSASQFDVPWWYVCPLEIPLPSSSSSSSSSGGGRNILTFHGINYRANVWFNGNLLGNSSEIVGSFRTFVFDVTSGWRDGENLIALEIFRPHDNWRSSSKGRESERERERASEREREKEKERKRKREREREGVDWELKTERQRDRDRGNGFFIDSSPLFFLILSIFSTSFLFRY